MAQPRSPHNGFHYEFNTYKLLRDIGIAFSTPSRNQSDTPDIKIKTIPDKTGQNVAGCELKMNPTTAGSLVLKYSQGWYYGFCDDPRKNLLMAMGETKNLLHEMNSGLWNGLVPHLQYNESGKKTFVNCATKMEGYTLDMIKFGGKNEIHFEIETKLISEYYQHLGCSYFNIGTHGIYLVNGLDPLGLNDKIDGLKIPNFEDCAKAKLRVRCQYKNKGDYQFCLSMEFNKLVASPYNLSPIKRGSVKIDKKKLFSDQNLKLLDAFTK